MRTLSTHQPVYLPSVMLFNKIALSDVFVFLSHVQFEGRSWQQRNRIRNGNEGIYLTVPVSKKGNRFQAIADTRIATDSDWRAKHLRGIRFAYQERPYFERYFPELEAMLSRDWHSLCDLNIALTQLILGWLEIGTTLLDSRDLHPEGKSNAMLVSLCREVGADRYVSNVGSRSYIDEALFSAAGVQHCWQDFRFPVYDQGAPFIDRLSVIDLLFNAGPAARSLVLEAGRVVERLDQVSELFESPSGEAA